MIRFIHTADWHLGKPFGGLPGDPGERLREARFTAVQTIARLTREHAADFVLVAGDSFDSNGAASRTLARAGQLLAAFDVPVVVLPGNHDALIDEGALARLRRHGLPPNVLIADEARPIVLLDGRVTVLPAPLRHRQNPVDATAWMAEPEAATPAGTVRIGLAHGGVEGLLRDDVQLPNPIARDRTDTARLDFLALGDWHGPLEVSPRCQYPGTPEPDRFDRRPGHALLVELEGPGAPPVARPLPTGRFRWERTAIDLSGAAAEAIEPMLAGLVAGLGRPEALLLQLAVSGHADLSAHAALTSATQRWRDQLLHLDLVEGALAVAPSDADLGAVDPATFEGQVLAKLRATAAGPDLAVAGEARRAMQLLWARLGEAA